MTFEHVIDQLVEEMISKIGHEEDLNTYREYIQIAIVIGAEIFGKDRGEIIAFDEAGNEVGRFINVNKAARTLHVARQNIDEALKGNRIHAGGYSFIRKYKDETKASS